MNKKFNYTHQYLSRTETKFFFQGILFHVHFSSHFNLRWGILGSLRPPSVSQFALPVPPPLFDIAECLSVYSALSLSHLQFVIVNRFWLFFDNIKRFSDFLHRACQKSVFPAKNTVQKSRRIVKSAGYPGPLIL